MTTRAYAVLDVKSIDEETRTIKGIASTPSTDRQDDIVEPMGAKFRTPMPLLWQHDTQQPVGSVTYAERSESGIPFEAEIARVDGPPGLKNRLDEAWASLKAGLVRGVSIGFKSLESEPIKGTYGLRFKKWEWLELSLVTIPANAEATITSIKAADSEQRTAPRVRTQLPVTYAGAAATKTEGKPMLKLSEQISQFEASRAAKEAARAAIMAKAGEEGRTLEQTEGEEYDGLTSEIDSIDKHLARLRVQDKQNRAALAPVKDPESEAANNNGDNANKDNGGGLRIRDGAQIITVQRELPKGRLFTRVCMALMAGKGNPTDTMQFAKQFTDTPIVAQVLALPSDKRNVRFSKAAVKPGTTTDPTWAEPLVAWQTMASEFVELLRPQTFLGRIEGMRRVPFKIKFPIQTSGSSVGWVGEGKPKPVSSLAFSVGQLDETKVAGIVVITDELARFSDPAAEGLVQDDLTAAIAQFLDQQFLDPTVAPLAGIHPGSITNGINAVMSSGTTDVALRYDVLSLYQGMVRTNYGPGGLVWLMPGVVSAALAMMVNAFGQPLYPSMAGPNPTLFGVPVIVSQGVPNTTNPSVNMIVLLRAPDILIADDGGVTVDTSNEASLEMDSAPTGTGTLVSLWQNNLVGIRAERYINWQRRRDSAVAYLSPANYGPPAPETPESLEAMRQQQEQAAAASTQAAASSSKSSSKSNS